MKVLDPGHVYGLANLDLPEEGVLRRRHIGLTFVKRVGDKYPGNTPPAHFGTTHLCRCRPRRSVQQRVCLGGHDGSQTDECRRGDFADERDVLLLNHLDDVPL